MTKRAYSILSHSILQNDRRHPFWSIQPKLEFVTTSSRMITNKNAMIEIINNIVINIGGSFWVDVQLRSSTLRLYRLAIAHLCALTKIKHSIDWKRLKFLLVIVGKELGEFVEIFGYKDLLTCLITCPFIERHVL